MRIKTFRWIAAAGVAFACGCEPAGLEVGAQHDEPTQPEAPVARARLVRALSRTPDNLRMRRLANGAQVAEVVSGFQHATIVTKTDAGLTQHCLTDPEEAVRLLEGRSK